MTQSNTSQKTDSAYAYECLRADIVSGRIRPDERIVESYYAQKLGISRTPVREALRLLERDGLVDFQPNRGATARAILDEGEAEEVFHLRELLQMDSAAATVENITHRELAAMAGCNAACAISLESEELDSFFRHYSRFEKILTQACKMPVLGKMFTFLESYNPMTLSVGLNGEWPEQNRLQSVEVNWSCYRRALRCHVAIWEALEQRDLEAYKAALHRLLDNDREQWAAAVELLKQRSYDASV